MDPGSRYCIVTSGLIFGAWTVRANSVHTIDTGEREGERLTTQHNTQESVTSCAVSCIALHVSERRPSTQIPDILHPTDPIS
jgi:hypothetical protein